MTKTRYLRHAVLVMAAALLSASCAGAPATTPAPGTWTGSPVVSTRSGAVRGHSAPDATILWKAIPFARPPVGDLRWRAPQEPVPWTGVRDPGSFNGGCTQYSPVMPGGIVGSEDCLYLNVWRPGDAETGLPVYVWIHGGGNSIGSATMVPDYYGNRIAARSRVVFVSLNYRLGPFGWFTHPALRDGASAEDASGNYGTLDIIAALRWIRDNIASFGGDPGCVTIAGESAGGFNVLSLLVATPAAGLFHRAMSESGAAVTRGVEEADARSAAVVEQLLRADGVAGAPAEAAAAMDPRRMSAYLRSKTDREIMACYKPGGTGMIDNPALIRDGAVLPRAGFDALSTGDYPNKVPVILGSNKEELKLFLFLSRAIPWQGGLYEAVARYASELWAVSGVDEVARRLTANPDQPPVYAYLFSWGAPDARGESPLPSERGRQLGAFHSLEIPFFLGTDTVDGFLQPLLFTPENEKGRKSLSAAMMGYAAAFARTGDPNHNKSGLPRWTPWSGVPGEGRRIVLDARGDEAAITMADTELTRDGIMAGIRDRVAEPLRTQLLDYLERSAFPSTVR
jgi:para-nitrobenzyl esterase